MKITILAALAAIPLLCIGPANAQQTGPPPAEEAVRRAYVAVDASVVRLRTVASIPVRAADARSDLEPRPERSLTAYGTGVVIGEIHVGDQWEYLILTNHHVADVSNYVIPEGRFFRENRHNKERLPRGHEQSHLLVTGADGTTSEILLVEVARDVRGDVALLRTVNTDRVLPVFGGPIGFEPGRVPEGAPVVTSGFPLRGTRIIALGTVVELDRPHEAGVPHADYAVDLPVEPGQSGSPVFLVEAPATGDPSEIGFSLVGLLHAREGEQRLMVPAPLWKAALEHMPPALRQRLIPERQGGARP